MIDRMGGIYQTVPAVNHLRLAAIGLAGLRFIVRIGILLGLHGAAREIGACGMWLPAVGQGNPQVFSRNFEDTRYLRVERRGAGIADMRVTQHTIIAVIAVQHGHLCRIRCVACGSRCKKVMLALSHEMGGASRVNGGF